MSRRKLKHRERNIVGRGLRRPSDEREEREVQSEKATRDPEVEACCASKISVAGIRLSEGN